MSNRRRLASWWVAPFTIATPLSLDDAQSAIAQVVQVAPLPRRIFGRAFYRTLEQEPSIRQLRIRTHAPLLSGRNILLPVAEGTITPSATGCIVEVQCRPRVIDIAFILGLLIVPGVLDREASWAGPIFAVLWVVLGSIYIVGPEVESLRSTLIRTLSGNVIAGEP